MEKEIKLEGGLEKLNQASNLAVQLQLLQQQQQLNEVNVIQPWPVQECQMMLLPHSSSISSTQPSTPTIFTNTDLPTDIQNINQQNINQQNINLIQLVEQSLAQGNDSTFQIANLDQNVLNSEIKLIDSSMLQQLYNIQQLPNNNIQQLPNNNINNTDNLINNFNAVQDSSNLLTTTPPAPPQKPRSYTRPPKKPLTPYMIFSKQIWPQVKTANPHLSSVCEIGSIVGSLWRDLSSEDKHVYNLLFNKDKGRYDTELREYLQQTGMTASDLVKPRHKRAVSTAKLNHHNPSCSQTTSQQTTNFQATATATNALSACSAEAATTNINNYLVNTSNNIHDNNNINCNNNINNNNTLNDQLQHQQQQQYQQQQYQQQQQVLVQNQDGSFNLDAASILSLFNLQQQQLQQQQLQQQQQQWQQNLENITMNLTGNE